MSDSHSHSHAHGNCNGHSHQGHHHHGVSFHTIKEILKKIWGFSQAWIFKDIPIEAKNELSKLTLAQQFKVGGKSFLAGMGALIFGIPSIVLITLGVTGMVTVVQPLKKPYHKYYIPLVVKAANFLGGRAKAGRLGRTSRILRVIGIALCLAAFISIVVSSVLTGGLAIPAWVSLLWFAGIGVNLIGIGLGTAGNHQKIEQYYDKRLALHADVNELQNAKKELAHGMDEPAHQLVQRGVRLLHDANGAAGTATTWVSSIWEWLAFAGLAVLDPPTAITLFAVSHISRNFSVFGAIGTNRHRLAVNKRFIRELMREYFAAKNTPDNQLRHEAIRQIVNDSFTDLNINKGSKYALWMEFHCYKAVDAALGKSFVPQDATKVSAVKETLTDALRSYTKPTKSWWQTLATPITYFMNRNDWGSQGGWRAKVIAFFTPAAEGPKHFSRSALRNVMTGALDSAIEVPIATSGAGASVSSTSVAAGPLFTTPTASPVIEANVTALPQKPVCVLDSLSVVEGILAQKVCGSSQNPHVTNYLAISAFVNSFAKGILDTQQDTFFPLFVYHLKRVLWNNSEPLDDRKRADFCEKLTKNVDLLKQQINVRGCIKNKRVDKNAVCNKYPLEGNPHGNEFVADYHMRKLAEAFGTRILGYQEELAAQVGVETPDIAPQPGTSPFLR